MPDTQGIPGWFAQYPEVMALLVLAFGGVLAYLSRSAVLLGVRSLNQAVSRRSSRAGPAISAGFSKLLQQFVFWVILLAAAVLAFTLLGESRFSLWLDRLWTIAFRILVALGILVAAHVLGVMARNALSPWARKVSLAALPRIAYMVILGTGLIMALGHVGLDVTFIAQLAIIVVAIFFAGLSLAFAIGARSLVANLAAQGDMQIYKPGDRISVDGTDGVILEIHRTGVVLSTAEGFARIPAAKFAETTVVLLRKQEPEDG